ncbi:MAG: hypothetical protein KME35_23800 [Aphanocapsa sp. GSE-SYN-MK-11-07L]|jgi:hypothetical protein|nr:hypothetical protein [Aphanocapsa sp. GSE-SYN-MK-11-07L]
MFATPIFNLSANSISLPRWTTDFQRFVFQAAIYSHAAVKAFNSAIAPRLIATTLTLSRHSFQAGQACGLHSMNAAGISHNPLQSAVRSGTAELTSAEAMATYRRIRWIAREAAMDALVIGLCGVVAIATTIEFAQAGYRKAAALYQRLEQRFSPSVSALWLKLRFRKQMADSLQEPIISSRLLCPAAAPAALLPAAQPTTICLPGALASSGVAIVTPAPATDAPVQVDAISFAIAERIEVQSEVPGQVVEDETQPLGAETVAPPAPDKPTRKPRQRSTTAKQLAKPTATKSQRKPATRP